MNVQMWQGSAESWIIMLTLLLTWGVRVSGSHCKSLKPGPQSPHV